VRSVVVTGMDVVTPIGVGLERFWKAAQAGTSGIRPITHFDPEGLPTRIAASLADPALLGELRGAEGLDALEPRSVVVGVWAARGAIDQAGAMSAVRGPRAGVFVGTGGERQDLRQLGAMAYAGRAPGEPPAPPCLGQRDALRRGTRRLQAPPQARAA